MENNRRSLRRSVSKGTESKRSKAGRSDVAPSLSNPVRGGKGDEGLAKSGCRRSSKNSIGVIRGR